MTDAAAETPASTPSQLDEIRAGYAFEGGTLKLGAVVIDDEAHPDAPVQIPLSVLNRHGLVAGATGTGKTKTLQLMAEQLSEQGVPVFLADLKGDLSGLATPGEGGPKITERATSVGMEWTRDGIPHRVLHRSAARAAASRSEPRSRASARPCCPRCWGSTTPRRAASG